MFQNEIYAFEVPMQELHTHTDSVPDDKSVSEFQIVATFQGPHFINDEIP